MPIPQIWLLLWPLPHYAQFCSVRSRKDPAVFKLCFFRGKGREISRSQRWSHQFSLVIILLAKTVTCICTQFPSCSQRAEESQKNLRLLFFVSYHDHCFALYGRLWFVFQYSLDFEQDKLVQNYCVHILIKYLR